MINYSTTKQALLAVPVPQETRTYKPVSNLQLMDTTLESIERAGFTLRDEIYTMGKEGMISTGKYIINNVGDNEMKLFINWTNSYDKTKPVQFSIGALVLVCTNGMMAMRNAFQFRKKHQADVQIFTPNHITEYIKKSSDMFAALQGEKEAMKQIELNRRLTAELIGRMYIEEQFLESTQLNILKRELENPTHKYSAPGSLWELFQHTTFAIGGIHPSRWMEDHMSAHRFFVDVVHQMHGEPEEAEVIEDTQLQFPWMI